MSVGRKNNRKAGPSQQTITRRGLRICQKDSQIKALGGDQWDVASQGANNEWYRVSFAYDGPTCECAYHTRGRGRRCKHIAAVEQLLAISSEPAPGGHTVIKEQEVRCPKCKREDYTRDGIYHGKYEDKQLYRCSCGRQFRDDPGVEYRQIPKKFITAVPPLYWAGASVANIRALLKHFGIKVHVDTVTRNTEYYSKLVEGHVKKIKPPCLGDKWGCDENTRRSAAGSRGSSRWCARRPGLCWRGAYRPQGKVRRRPLLRAAKDVAGGAPRLFITDGLSKYNIAFKKVHCVVRGLMCWHVRYVHIRNRICNINTQERLNGEFADRFRSARGVNREDSPIFRITIIHHNFIKPHGE